MKMPPVRLPPPRAWPEGRVFCWIVAWYRHTGRGHWALKSIRLCGEATPTVLRGERTVALFGVAGPDYHEAEGAAELLLRSIDSYASRIADQRRVAEKDDWGMP